MGLELAEWEQELFTAKGIAELARYTEPVNAASVSTLAFRHEGVSFLKSMGEKGPRRMRRYSFRQLMSFSCYFMASEYLHAHQKRILEWIDDLYQHPEKRFGQERLDYLDAVNGQGLELGLVARVYEDVPAVEFVIFNPGNPMTIPTSTPSRNRGARTITSFQLVTLSDAIRRCLGRLSRTAG